MQYFQLIFTLICLQQNPPPTPTIATDDGKLPVLAIVFIAIGVYIFVIIAGLIIRQLLMVC